MSENNKIFTHDEAMLILQRCEDILISNNICVPSPEDDERDTDDMIGFYGSTYTELLDTIEADIIKIIEQVKSGADVVTDEFSGDV